MTKTVYLNKEQVETLVSCILADIKSEEYSVPDFSDSSQTKHFFVRSVILDNLKKGAPVLAGDEIEVGKAILEISTDFTLFDMQHEIPDFTDTKLTKFWHNRATMLEKLQSAK